MEDGEAGGSQHALDRTKTASPIRDFPQHTDQYDAVELLTGERQIGAGIAGGEPDVGCTGRGELGFGFGEHFRLKIE